MTTQDARSTTIRKPANERRAQIRDVAAQLFDRLGYRETSMDKIADEVGVKKASLYYHFPAKEQLLIEMHDEMIELIVSSHETRLAEGVHSASDLILGMITDVISLQVTHPGSLRVFFEHYRELPEPERSRVLERRATYERYLRDQLQRGIDDGEFRPVDIRLTSFAILGMANWSYQWFRPDGPAAPEDVAEEFWRIVSGGIAAS